MPRLQLVLTRRRKYEEDCILSLGADSEILRAVSPPPRPNALLAPTSSAATHRNAFARRQLALPGRRSRAPTRRRAHAGGSHVAGGRRRRRSGPFSVKDLPGITDPLGFNRPAQLLRTRRRARSSSTARSSSSTAASPCSPRSASWASSSTRWAAPIDAVVHRLPGDAARPSGRRRPRDLGARGLLGSSPTRPRRREVVDPLSYENATSASTRSASSPSRPPSSRRCRPRSSTTAACHDRHRGMWSRSSSRAGSSS